jgi:pre-peptidase
MSVSHVVRGWLLPLAMALCVLAFPGAVRAAAPAGGTIGPGSSSVSWTGQYYAAAAVSDPTLCPPAAVDPTNTICDHFALTVSSAGTVTVGITWPSPTCADNPTNPTPGTPCDVSGNDFDLYVYNSLGLLVASSADPNPPGSSEAVAFAATPQTYEVRVVPFFVVNSDYAGEATFTGPDGTGPTCLMIATIPGPPKAIQVEVQDTESGLGAVLVTASDNANTVVPPFEPGTNDPVVITSTKVDQASSSRLALSVSDVAGNVTLCDPVVPGSKNA